MKQLSALGEGDVLFLAGSIPSSMADDAYQKIMEMLDSKGIRIVVDATRDLLMKVLPYHPFLIKPNNHELGEIFGVELKTRESVVPYAKQLQKRAHRTFWFPWQAKEPFSLPHPVRSLKLRPRKESLSTASAQETRW